MQHHYVLIVPDQYGLFLWGEMIVWPSRVSIRKQSQAVKKRNTVGALSIRYLRQRRISLV